MADLDTFRKAIREMAMDGLREADRILRDEFQLRRRAEESRAAADFRIGDRVSFGGTAGGGHGDGGTGKRSGFGGIAISRRCVLVSQDRARPFGADNDG